MVIKNMESFEKMDSFYKINCVKSQHNGTKHEYHDKGGGILSAYPNLGLMSIIILAITDTL